MKTPVAAAISIAGVLVAGSAAAMVNSQVFDSTPNESGASAAVLPPPSSVEVSIPDPTIPPTSTVTTTATTSSTAPATTAAAATGMLTAFEVGDAGVVTVDVIEGRLVFVSAEASPGWRIVEQSDDDDEDGSADEVEVVFESSTVRVDFEAKLIAGEIVPHVESEAIGVASAPRATAPRATSPANTSSAPVVTYDDHDDDRYDDDDHDDDDRYEDHDDDDHDDDRYEDDDRDDD